MKNKIFLQEKNGKGYYIDFSSGCNSHLYISGKSGSGKTVFLKMLVANIAECGGTIVQIVTNHNATGPALKTVAEKYSRHVHSVNIRTQGFGCPELIERGQTNPREDVTDGALGNLYSILSRMCAMKSRQKGCLRSVLEYCWESRELQTVGTKVLDSALADLGTARAESLRDNLDAVIRYNFFRPAESPIQKGRINVLDLSDFPFETQPALAEAILLWLWGEASKFQFAESGLFIVVDEAQNLPSGKYSTLAQILSEGRKYGLGLIIATQQIKGITKDYVSQRALQCSTQIFFCQDSGQADMVAKMLSPNRPDKWVLQLKHLGIGEYVVLSDALCCGETSLANKPIIFRPPHASDVNDNNQFHTTERRTIYAKRGRD